MIFGLEISGEFRFGSELFEVFLVSKNSGLRRRKPRLDLSSSVGEKDESKTSVESKPKLVEALGVIAAVEIK